MLTLPVLAFLGLFLLLKLSSALNCSSNSESPDYQPFPKNVTPAQFHTRMEVTLSNRNETFFVDEKFDAVNQRGYVTYLKNNMSWEVYYDKAESEIDRVLDEDCWSYNWTLPLLERLKCLYPKNESSLKLIGGACSATVVLDLVYKNKTADARYLGRKIVRNVPVNGWRICKNSTALDFWFSVKGWSHSNGVFPTPVVVEARPSNASQLVGGLIHSYSFLDFFHDEPGFKVPGEFWCRGAYNPPPLPRLPRRFDVNLESVNTESSRIRGVRQYYDLDKQLYRVDYDARGTQPPVLGTGPSIDIRNMRNGVSTRYNRKSGRCKEYRAYAASFIPTRYNYRIDVPFGKVVLFEDPQATPTYRGKRTTREIQCNVWQQNRVNWPGNVTGEMVWRWYFNRNSWVENKEPQPVPVKLEIEGKIQMNATFEAEFEFNLNFYAFESQTPTPDAFNVSAFCAKEPTAKQATQYSSGAVAGISIGCIVVGLVLGAVVVYFVVKRYWPSKMGPPSERFP